MWTPRGPLQLAQGARVVVAMSGGVDSSVTALLLQRTGRFAVSGLYMHNWDERDEQGDAVCRGEQDWADAQHVARLIGVPIRRVDYVKEYWNDVFEPLLAGYRNGATPNVDLLCNREIKFNVFLRDALRRGQGGQQQAYDAVATGHYARVGVLTNQGSPHPVLLRARDKLRDQAYFLAAIDPKALENVVFPIGDMTKEQVRQIAKDAGLPVAAKPKSVGLCFVGKRRSFADFLGGYIDQRQGPFVSVDDGRVVGTHIGVPFYTIGQGAGIGGSERRWFVADKNVAGNIVYVAEDASHPALLTKSLMAAKVSWWVPPSASEFACDVQVRSMKEPSPGVVKWDEGNGTMHVSLSEPQRSIAPGQAIVLSQGDLIVAAAEVTDRVPVQPFTKRAVVTEQETEEQVLT